MDQQGLVGKAQDGGCAPAAAELPIRIVLERGPKGKKAVAFAVGWPGWSQGAKTAAEALATLASYRQRYRPIALAVGPADELDTAVRGGACRWPRKIVPGS